MTLKERNIKRKAVGLKPIKENKESDRIIKVGRKSKKKAFLEAAEEVLSEKFNAIIFTDRELVQEICLRMKNDSVSYDTFKSWKRDSIYGICESPDEVKAFFDMYDNFKRQQKSKLIDLMLSDNRSYTKYQWLLERVFDNLNLKTKQQIETVNTNNNYTINVLYEEQGIPIKSNEVVKLDVNKAIKVLEENNINND